MYTIFDVANIIIRSACPNAPAEYHNEELKLCVEFDRIASLYFLFDGIKWSYTDEKNQHDIHISGTISDWLSFIDSNFHAQHVKIYGDYQKLSLLKKLIEYYFQHMNKTQFLEIVTFFRSTIHIATTQSNFFSNAFMNTENHKNINSKLFNIEFSLDRCERYLEILEKNH